MPKSWDYDYWTPSPTPSDHRQNLMNMESSTSEDMEHFYAVLTASTSMVADKLTKWQQEVDDLYMKSKRAMEIDNLDFTGLLQVVDGHKKQACSAAGVGGVAGWGGEGTLHAHGATVRSASFSPKLRLKIESHMKCCATAFEQIKKPDGVMATLTQ